MADTMTNGLIKGASDPFCSVMSMLRTIAYEEDYQRAEDILQENKALKQQLDEKTRQQEKLIKEHKVVNHEILTLHREAIAGSDSQTQGLRDQLMEKGFMTESLQADAQKLKEQVSHLIAEKAELSEQFKSSESILTITKSALQQALQKVNDKEGALKANQERIKVQDKLIIKLEATKNEIQTALNASDGRLRQCNTDLQAVKNFSIELKPDNVEQVKNKFESFWRKIWAAVSACFDENLEDSVLRDKTRWGLLEAKPQVNYGTPLPLSNSMAAKTARKHVLTAIITEFLHVHVFTTTPLVTGDRKLRDALYNLAIDEPQKEVFLRGILASLGSGNTSERHNDLASTAILRELNQAIISCVRAILRSDTFVTFEEELTTIICEIDAVWKELQQRQSRFEAIMYKRADDSGSWLASVPAANQKTSSKAIPLDHSQLKNDVPVLTLFPSIIILQQGKDETLLAGHVVQDSQLTAVREESRKLNFESQIDSGGIARVRSGRAPSIGTVKKESKSKATVRN